jgi:hypothetical protein
VSAVPANTTVKNVRNNIFTKLSSTAV